MKPAIGDDRDALPVIAGTWRRWIIEQSFASNVGHIGSALSVVEMMAVLWARVLRSPGSDDPDRDRFVLAKGHAALALYCAMRWKGLISQVTFQTYCHDGSHLGVHPSASLPGIDASTGSLGQGLSIACGLAYGLKLSRSPARVYALLSDAECNEGQVWEAVMLSAHHQLGNLTVLVDVNGSQALGPTRGVLDLQPMAAKWRAFGWQADEVDGHDVDALEKVLTSPTAPSPRVVLAQTVLGKGLSFMENKVEWHYRNLTDDLYQTAQRELEISR